MSEGERKKRKFWRKKRYIAAGVVVFIIAVLWWGWSGGSEERYDTAVVEKGEVLQTVSATGKVMAVEDVDLSFQAGGRVAAVYAEVGDYVLAGQVLAQIDDADIRAQVREAEANVAAQEAKLAQSKRGTRPEEIEITENDLANAYLPVPDILNDARIKAEDALFKQVDPIFDNDSTSPTLTFTITDTQIRSDVESGRNKMTAELNGLRDDINGVKVTETSSLDTALVSVKQRLSAFEDFLALALRAVNLSVGLTASDEATYKTNVNTARANINTAIDSVTAQQKTIASAKSALTLERAGTTAEDIDYQEAQVEQARAKVDSLEAQMARTRLVTPISGVVAARMVERGEYAGAGTEAFTVISSSRFKVESNIPEADIAKIKEGDKAEVTLDAYTSDDKFAAGVTKIDPAETVIEGVSTYKITLIFKERDERIKPGMTANIEIETDRREGALFVPLRAVIKEDGTSYVRIKPRSEKLEPEKRKVGVGLRGSDGKAEVISGLEEGEKVIVFDRLAL